ncbi:unnamed protein product [Fusarium venenatum]|uniref:NACHT domain-containing protein n=1 Tax=Fusarium venenatum TaxID=56646 RepID=A0A2L2SY66_9HYPO|nr:uncharacterized protein FVRRES_13796 [Fusarium venenatum]CEI41901.1 unnamed protein product [Fusarium venenatum]
MVTRITNDAARTSSVLVNYIANFDRTPRPFRLDAWKLAYCDVYHVDVEGGSATLQEIYEERIREEELQTPAARARELVRYNELGKARRNAKWMIPAIERFSDEAQAQVDQERRQSLEPFLQFSQDEEMRKLILAPQGYHKTLERIWKWVSPTPPAWIQKTLEAQEQFGFIYYMSREVEQKHGYNWHSVWSGINCHDLPDRVTRYSIHCQGPGNSNALLRLETEKWPTFYPNESMAEDDDLRKHFRGYREENENLLSAGILRNTFIVVPIELTSEENRQRPEDELLDPYWVWAYDADWDSSEEETVFNGERYQGRVKVAIWSSAIEDGRSRLESLEQQLQPSTHRKVMSRFGARAFKWPFECKEVEGTIQNLVRCRENISLALNIDQTVILQNVDERTTLSQLPAADGASFDSRAEEHNPTCLPDTREELLGEIDHWINDPKSKTIFWLNGKAGTGKSTISRTVAWSRSRQGDLGASFFFKRGEVDRGNLSKFVSMVARRLAWSTPAVAPFIKSAVNADPEIADKAVREQFKKLIQEPLSKTTVTSLSRPLVVIVVDALDECEKDDDIKLFLQLFSNLRSAGPLRVRVLVTSRPELPVRLGFSSIGNAHQDLILHKIPLPIIEHDISVFLRHEFANIRNSFNKNAVEELKLPMDWPGEANLGKLTTAAAPLFIFAATLCRFINDSYLGSPDELLQSVLSVAGTGQGSKLDMTYSPVLRQQVLNRSGSERLDIIESFRLIVGTIVTLANPLSMRALALLLDIQVSKVTTRLSALHSVLDIPETLDTPVRLLHLSFREYLVGLEKRELAEFRVEERHTHKSLAKHCLRIMRGGLRKNACVDLHWTLGEEIIPLDGYVYVSSFATDGRGIITGGGVFALSDVSQPHAEPAMLRQSSEASILTCIDGTWITAAGEDLLWLPPECRNGEVTVSGSTVAIGCRSGRVLVLGISMSEVEQWTDT